MNGRERVLAMLEGRPVDRLPAMPITMMYAADTIGVRYGEYARNHRVLVEAQVATVEAFGFDHVSAISDPAREVADLGGAVEWFDDQPPAVVERRARLLDRSELDSLTIPDLGAGRMHDRIEAVRSLHARVGDRLAVEGWVEGPMALAADLRGLNTLMLDFSDEPEFVERLFAFCVEMETDFARAQVEAGADLIGVGDAAASLIGPRRYAELVLPHETRLVAAIQAMGAKVRLHICGNTRRILGAMGRSGADMIDLDAPSPLDAAREAMGPSPALLGNLDPVRLLRDGTAAEVTAAVAECYRGGGPRYIVGAGCEIARGTPPENVHAMVEFARSHGHS
jgi:MtaA/CmuA family methyltransferase